MWGREERAEREKERRHSEHATHSRAPAHPGLACCEVLWERLIKLLLLSPFTHTHVCIHTAQTQPKIILKTHTHTMLLSRTVARSSLAAGARPACARGSRSVVASCSPRPVVSSSALLSGVPLSPSGQCGECAARTAAVRACVRAWQLPPFHQSACHPCAHWLMLCTVLWVTHTSYARGGCAL